MLGENIILISHSKSIKPQHVNKLRLHLTRRGMQLQLIALAQDISNICQWQYVLQSLDTDLLTGCYKSTEYRFKVERKTSDSNDLKSIRNNLNNLSFPVLIQIQ